MSGVVSLLLFVPIYFIFILHAPRVRQIFYFSILIFGALFSVWIAISYSFRLQQYLNHVPVVMELFSNPDASPPELVRVQYVNIYPIIMMYQDLLELDVFHVFFGSGIGSAAFENFRGGLHSHLSNPHSEIIRQIYDFGLVGVFVYILVIRKMYVSMACFIGRRRNDIFFILVIASYYGHRSYMLMVCLGLLYVASFFPYRDELCSRAAFDKSNVKKYCDNVY